MSVIMLHNVNNHQNNTLTCIARIYQSLLASTKCQHYKTIVIVLTIVIYQNSSIVMLENLTIAKPLTIIYFQ